MGKKTMFDYRVIEMRVTCKFDYIENDVFEEFYLKFKELCDEYDVRMNKVTRIQDIMNYETVQKDSDDASNGGGKIA